MIIDSGLVVGDYWVEEQFAPDLPAWWMSCGRHRFFATSAQIEAGTISCPECKSDAAVRAQTLQVVREAQDEIDAGDFSRRIT
jgi:hypothetical protein